MSSRITSEARTFRGSSVYLTVAEKESLKRAIQDYIENVEGADGEYAKFYEKYDNIPLHTAYVKLCRK